MSFQSRKSNSDSHSVPLNYLAQSRTSSKVRAVLGVTENQLNRLHPSHDATGISEQ